MVHHIGANGTRNPLPNSNNQQLILKYREEKEERKKEREQKGEKGKKKKNRKKKQKKEKERRKTEKDEKNRNKKHNKPSMNLTLKENPRLIRAPGRSKMQGRLIAPLSRFSDGGNKSRKGGVLVGEVFVPGNKLAVGVVLERRGNGGDEKKERERERGRGK